MEVNLIFGKTIFWTFATLTQAIPMEFRWNSHVRNLSRRVQADRLHLHFIQRNKRLQSLLNPNCKLSKCKCACDFERERNRVGDHIQTGKLKRKTCKLKFSKKKKKRKFHIWIVNEEKALKGKMQNELKAGARNPISNVWGECDKCNLSFIPSETFRGYFNNKKREKNNAWQI